MNQVNIIGRLGKNPETRFSQDGSPVCGFTVATSEKWKDKNGDKKEETEWHKITAFGKLAEICGKYLTKGSQVFVSGKIKTDSWDDKDGVKKYSTKIIISTMEMLGDKKHSETPQTAPAPDDIPF